MKQQTIGIIAFSHTDGALLKSLLDSYNTHYIVFTTRHDPDGHMCDAVISTKRAHENPEYQHIVDSAKYTLMRPAAG